MQNDRSLKREENCLVYQRKTVSSSTSQTQVARGKDPRHGHPMANGSHIGAINQAKMKYFFGITFLERRKRSPTLGRAWDGLYSGHPTASTLYTSTICRKSKCLR